MVTDAMSESSFFMMCTPLEASHGIFRQVRKIRSLHWQNSIKLRIDHEIA